MGTTVQKVERVVLDDLFGPWLADLQSRLLRQQDLGVDTEVDVWAIGCIFAEIFNGMPLFPGDSDLHTL